MRILLALLLSAGLAAAQNSSPANGHKSDSTSSKNASQPNPNLAPPRSDRVDAATLPDDIGDSSSKETQIDVSPPPNDAKEHPQSGEILMDEGSSGSSPTDLHPWDPHKAAKDIEVGNFYFKQKKYAAAESRYREALTYKDNDAEATFRLAVCLDKMNRPDEAIVEYQNYLKILPYGAEAPEAKRAIERMKAPSASTKPN